MPVRTSDLVLEYTLPLSVHYLAISYHLKYSQASSSNWLLPLSTNRLLWIPGLPEGSQSEYLHCDALYVLACCPSHSGRWGYFPRKKRTIFLPLTPS